MYGMVGGSSDLAESIAWTSITADTLIYSLVSQGSKADFIEENLQYPISL